MVDLLYNDENIKISYDLSVTLERGTELSIR